MLPGSAGATETWVRFPSRGPSPCGSWPCGNGVSVPDLPSAQGKPKPPLPFLIEFFIFKTLGRPYKTQPWGVGTPRLVFPAPTLKTYTDIREPTTARFL